MIPAPKAVWAYAWVEPSPNGEGAVRASGRGSREATEAEQKDRGRSVLLSHVEEYVPAAEVTRLRAALAGIAALQTTPHVGEPHRGERHVDKKSAYYAGAFDGRADGRFECAEMARKGLAP